MNGSEVLEISSSAIWTVFKMSLPIMLGGMSVGLIIALFQALTQIQEITLTFVPKIIAIFLCLIVFMSYIASSLQDFSTHIFDMMVKI